MTQPVTAQRWIGNRLAVSPGNALHVKLGRSRRRRRELGLAVAELTAGTPVVLSACAPGAIRRCRRFADRVGIALDAEYLAFPSAATPAYLVEDHPAAIATFVRTFLIAPPGSVLTTPMDAALALLRAPGARRVIRRLTPGRLVVGRRT